MIFLNESYEQIASNVQSSLRANTPDVQKAYTIIEETNWFSLRTMNILFKVSGVETVPYELITQLLDDGWLVRHDGIFDTYYVVTDKFSDQGVNIH